jgi:hypothetical protein
MIFFVLSIFEIIIKPTFFPVKEIKNNFGWGIK